MRFLDVLLSCALAAVIASGAGAMILHYFIKLNEVFTNAFQFIK